MATNKYAVNSQLYFSDMTKKSYTASKEEKH